MNDHSTPVGLRPFRDPRAIHRALAGDAAAKVLAGAGDMVFMLDEAGTILDLAISGGDGAIEGIDDWIGDALVDHVTVESKPKIREMLAGGASGATARWRQVNHPTTRGDVPVRYLLLAAGSPACYFAVGRDVRGMAAMQQRLLQTQQSLERDYMRLRQAESRYRLLFDLAGEPMLIVDAATRRVREANPMAHRLLDARDGTLAGQPASLLVTAAEREEAVAFFGAATVGEVEPRLFGLARGGAVRVAAASFRQDRQAYLLLRLAVPDAGEHADGTDRQVRDIVERMPDAFVLTDRTLVILAANVAFVELAEARSAEQIVGANLGAWLGRPGIDLDLIVAQLREHGAVRNVATIVRGGAGTQEEVEVSGVAAPHEDGERLGFTIRGVARRTRDLPPAERDLPRSVEQLTELVGRVSLKDIVRESTDLIERLCIEAALAYTSDNRASAAEILGLSRQSLYSKLHRHGLGNLVAGGES